MGGFMKNFRFFLVFLFVVFLSLATMAQSPWILQLAPGLSQPAPMIWFSAVDSNVCWGIKVSLFDNSRQTPQIIRTTNCGSSWGLLTVPGVASGLEGTNIAALDANTAWALMWDRSGETNGGVFKTTDAGIGWTRDTTIFRSQGGQEGIHFFDSNNGVVYGSPRAGYWEIYTTTDGGAHWIRVPSANIPPPQSGDDGLDGQQITSIGNTLWFCTFLRSVYKTTDRGMTWTVARNVLGSDGVGLVVAFKDEMNGLACSPFNNTGGNRIHKTTDGGATWTSLPPGSIPATPSAIWLAYDPVSHLYVMTSHHFTEFTTITTPGSAYSTDDGLSWNQIDILPHGPAVFTYSGVGWSDGANDSVYKWDSGVFTSVKEVNKIVDSYNLEQNYPNPFNPSTTIRFQVPNSSFVNLKVYDVLGKEVATLVNGEKPAGSYEVEFNAVGLPSEVYFYRIQAGNFVEMKKMLLLK
jgi:photosystem II stability/assembly factor-like uncharacterized protein